MRRPAEGPARVSGGTAAGSPGHLAPAPDRGGHERRRVRGLQPSGPAGPAELRDQCLRHRCVGRGCEKQPGALSHDPDTRARAARRPLADSAAARHRTRQPHRAQRPQSARHRSAPAGARRVPAAALPRDAGLPGDAPRLPHQGGAAGTVGRARTSVHPQWMGEGPQRLCRVRRERRSAGAPARPASVSDWTDTRGSAVGSRLPEALQARTRGLQRGEDKRRQLLEYLRRHPEELRSGIDDSHAFRR